MVLTSLLPPPPRSFEIKLGNKVSSSRLQLPLSLAYALSVHKSQGTTLPSACVDLRNVFAPGMAYVALSRVKSLEGLSVIGEARFGIVHERVKEFFGQGEEDGEDEEG